MFHICISPENLKLGAFSYILENLRIKFPQVYYGIANGYRSFTAMQSG